MYKNIQIRNCKKSSKMTTKVDDAESIINNIITRNVGTISKSICDNASKSELDDLINYIKTLTLKKSMDNDIDVMKDTTVKKKESVSVSKQFVLPNSLDKLADFFSLIDQKLVKKVTTKEKYFNLLTFKVISDGKILSQFKSGRQNIEYDNKQYKFAGPTEIFNSEDWRKFKSLVEGTKHNTENKIETKTEDVFNVESESDNDEVAEIVNEVSCD